MKNTTILLLSLFILCFSFIACEEEPQPAIDVDLLVYVEDFIFEANERDYIDENGNALHIDSLGIEVMFTNISNSAVIGRCNRDENDEGVSISIDPLFWKTSTELEKEYIMFHELGHCVLNRNHTTQSDMNSTCLSIMEPGTGEVCQSNYTTSTRSALLDELFSF